MKQEQYIIETIKDLAELVTEENVEELVKDTEAFLRGVVSSKKSGIYKIMEISQIKWVSDGKNEVRNHVKGVKFTK